MNLKGNIVATEVDELHDAISLTVTIPFPEVHRPKGWDELDFRTKMALLDTPEYREHDKQFEQQLEALKRQIRLGEVEISI